MLFAPDRVVARASRRGRSERGCARFHLAGRERTARDAPLNGAGLRSTARRQTTPPTPLAAQHHDEGSSGHVVAHRWPKWGSTCHQARLAFGSTLQPRCTGAGAIPVKRPTSATASERERILICGSSKQRVGRPPSPTPSKQGVIDSRSGNSAMTRCGRFLTKESRQHPTVPW